MTVPTFSKPTKARSVLSNRHRNNAPPAAIDEARRDLAAANIAAAIERHLAKAPPLTDEQAEGLAALIRGGDAKAPPLTDEQAESLAALFQGDES